MGGEIEVGGNANCAKISNANRIKRKRSTILVLSRLVSGMSTKWPHLSKIADSIEKFSIQAKKKSKIFLFCQLVAQNAD